MKKSAKPFYKKWWFWAIVALLIIGAIGGGASADPDDEPTLDASVQTDNTSQSVTTTESTDQNTERVDEYAVIDRFIEILSTEADASILEVVKMDIHGDDYKVEFRLNAFENAVGKKGTTGSATIEIINYGVWDNDSIRVYATFPSHDDAVAFAKTVIPIYDASITDEEITENLDRSTSIVLGLGGYITGYINNTNSGDCDLMIDCTKLNFME